ncbi:glycosyltransferase family 2 protein [Blastopirellula sp. J2-11]|uniref:glycosyltransferase family 2 protein n=1 Tax=Blastopirellula sp. J2-11 TaxID=2943192 RepID=UPI0021CA0853|nr:glycosyltransferase family 2 protein [Blastopirellula sp. J2-11]UUO05073.1 glycosyltransferase family 2 protein [Blastopirellula sp. J2-11]
MRLSAVIPVYNEADSLRELHRELTEVAAANGYPMEIIFVDDGSSDASWEVERELAESDPQVKAIRFRRNFGKAAALDAGFRVARGELIMTLDADLQDDPHEIPRFLEQIEKGFDVVSGYKQVRHDPWHKVLPSRIFNWMVSTLTGVRLHDHNCGMKCYRREIFEEVRLYGELHRFVPVLASARGWKIGEIVIQHRARQHGQSKYGFFRIFKGFLDLLTVKFITGFGQRPQHLLGGIGLAFFAFGGLGMTVLAIWWCLSRIPALGLTPLNIHETAMIFYVITALLLGTQFLMVGLLAELITAQNSRGQSPYSISETAGYLKPHDSSSDQSV